MCKLFILKYYCAFIVVVLRLRYEVFILRVNYKIFHKIRIPFEDMTMSLGPRLVPYLKVSHALLLNWL